MSPNCAFLLDSGLPCRAPALHNDRYCRHHTPAALARHRARRLYPDSASDPAQSPSHLDLSEPPVIPPSVLRAYWRRQHRTIAHSDAETCDSIFAMILDALGTHDISPRSAGRLLQAILDRRQVLANQAQEAAFRTLEEKVRQHKALARRDPRLDPVSPDGGRQDDAHSSLLEALTNAVFSAPANNHTAQRPFGASENYPVFR